jgi:hypothetical protein
MEGIFLELDEAVGSVRVKDRRGVSVKIMLH